LVIQINYQKQHEGTGHGDGPGLLSQQASRRHGTAIDIRGLQDFGASIWTEFDTASVVQPGHYDQGLAHGALERRDAQGG
jgi:hypothetical protein